MIVSKIRFGLLAVSMLVLITADIRAATHAVDSLATLQSRIDSAVAGDAITLKDGVYAAGAAIEVACTGAPGKPITISAESIGGVEIDGAAGFAVKAPAAYVVIEGFRFKHAAGHNTIAAGATHVRFTRNIFNCSGPGAELDVAGDDAEVDHNEFRDKSTVGNMVSVTGVEPQVARRLWLHHNYFHDYANAHANGAETVRFGRSFLSMSRGDGLIEYNLFLRCTAKTKSSPTSRAGIPTATTRFWTAPAANSVSDTATIA